MIDEKQAVEIVKDLFKDLLEPLQIVAGVPDGLHLYGGFSRSPENVWSVFYSSHPGAAMVGGCRVIVIDKASGKVLCDQLSGE